MAKLQPHAVKLITEIVERYKDEPTPTMMILEDIQKEYGYIPLEVQELVSELTGVPVSDIYGVVTFYSFFIFVLETSFEVIDEIVELFACGNYLGHWGPPPDIGFLSS